MTQFEALAGGTVTLSALKIHQYRHSDPGKRRHCQRLERGGADELHGDQRLDLLDVASLQLRQGRGQRLASLSNVNLNVAGLIDISGLTSLSNINLTVTGTGEDLTLSGLTSFKSGNITVSGGASLSLPG